MSPRRGVFLAPFDELADPRVLAGLAADAEQAGWDGFFVWDHVTYGRGVGAVADPWVALAAVAVATERLRVGPLVTPLPRRRPAKVARETATLDLLSGGRLVLGVGIGSDGWHELSATGEQLDDRARGAMLDEALEVLRAAWSGEVLEHRGAAYVVDGIRFLPTPAQRPGPPVWVAVRGHAPRPLRRAARHDGVFPIDLAGPDDLAALLGELDRPEGAYDVVVTQPPGADPAPWAAAGATWVLAGPPLDRLGADEVRGWVRDGPAG